MFAIKRTLSKGRVRPRSERIQTFAMKRMPRNEPGERRTANTAMHCKFESELYFPRSASRSAAEASGT